MHHLQASCISEMPPKKKPTGAAVNKKATPQRLEFSGASLMNFYGLLTFLKPVTDVVKQMSYR